MSLPARRLSGETLRFLVDTSTRSFRRSCSAPRFPAERLERDVVKLKATPIQFRWRTASVEEEPCGVPVEETKPPAWQPVVDPHRIGYGKIPVTPWKVRLPPPARTVEGILGR